MPCLQPCSHAGCPELVSYGRCEKHRDRKPEPTFERIESKRAYCKADWRKTREALLAMNPVCEDCGKAFATEAHHVKRRKAGGGMEFENLKALCKPCHSRRTARGE